MIYVAFPQGCYGSYVARCIYTYTNLNCTKLTDFKFDNVGSSHEIRKNKDLRSKIVFGHLTDISIEASDPAISIVPSQQHLLDYFNNQFAKQQQFDLVSYIDQLLPKEDIVSKLKNWNLDQSSIKNTPIWIQREFFSFWIADCLQASYNSIPYQQVLGMQLSTVEIFNNFSETFDKIVDYLDLKICVSNDCIMNNHTKFVQNQQFHNSQIDCEKWIDSVLLNQEKSLSAPCQTIFDEAYVQHLFRKKGYEIKCDGLDVFPNNSTKMKDLIYAN